MDRNDNYVLQKHHLYLRKCIGWLWKIEIRILHARGIHKKPGNAVPTSDIVDFKWKAIKTDKEVQYSKIKG
jgi:hypothetical protein